MGGASPEVRRRSRLDFVTGFRVYFRRRAEENGRQMRRRSDRSIKCLVWDLDRTLWTGALLEGDPIELRRDSLPVLRALDERGILHSIASRNEPRLALAKVDEFELTEYFLHPQINWGSKAVSLGRISEALNISPDSLAFVDDDPVERAEVRHRCPEVLCIDAADLGKIPQMPAMTPANVTEDSRNRRRMYLSEMKRKVAEEDFRGPAEEFLATLDMTLRIAPAGRQDLARIDELTRRTNQLNSTGYTYSREDLARLCDSPAHQLWLADLSDRFGPYGKIGLAMLECGAEAWTIKLLLTSCRVMSRGVGSILINHLKHRAASARVRLMAEFLPTDRNRMMYVAYRMSGFREMEGEGEIRVLEADLSVLPPFPDYLTLRLAE